MKNESYEIKRLKEIHFETMEERDKAVGERDTYLNLLEEMCKAIEKGDDAKLKSAYLSALPELKKAGV